MKRYFLSKKDIKDINSKYPQADLKKTDKVEYIKQDGLELIQINDAPGFFYKYKKLYPSLRFIHGKEQGFKKITVDMGAVKFVCSGADVMRPGIKEIDDNIEKGDTVIIVDEKNKKALAVGIALDSAQTLENTKTGKSVKNIHYAGDRIWNFKLE
ncbi:MAG: DUF1947 domain-containing protein [archaeon]